MIYLVNWTHTHNISGGSETRYSILKSIFPKAQLVSACDLEGSSIHHAVDAYLSKTVDRNDTVIKDAGVGSSQQICKKVLFFGNPYKSLIQSNKFQPSTVAHWKKLLWYQKLDAKTADFCIANSRFSLEDYGGCACTLNNCVDIDFFKPDSKAKKEYILSVGSKFKFKYSGINFTKLEEQVGIPIKKVYKESNHTKQQMLEYYQKAICYFHPFWIEGNSNAVLEALSCDLPVVTPKCGLFYSEDINTAGELYQDQDSAVRSILQVLAGSNAYAPRNFIIKNKLTKEDYIRRIRILI